MTMNYWYTTEQLKEIKELYLSGHSAQEIKEKLEIPHTVRSVQRRLKTMGISRTIKEAFQLAVKKGRVTYHTNPNKIDRKTLSHRLRAEVYARDGFRCVRCGNTAKDDRLQIDHIDEEKNNNILDNLQILCESCNKGKHYLSTENRSLEELAKDHNHPVPTTATEADIYHRAPEVTLKLKELVPHSPLKPFPKPGHK